MLEAGGSLRTWALDRPIEPDRAQPARSLAPHRLHYLDYEGEVSGGRGVVRRWDAGRFAPIEWGDRRVVVDLEGAYVKGEAVLALEVAGPDEPRAGWVFRLRGKVERRT